MAAPDCSNLIHSKHYCERTDQHARRHRPSPLFFKSTSAARWNLRARVVPESAARFAGWSEPYTAAHQSTGKPVQRYGLFVGPDDDAPVSAAFQARIVGVSSSGYR